MSLPFSIRETKNPLRLQEVVDERVCALVLRKEQDGREGRTHCPSLIQVPPNLVKVRGANVRVMVRRTFRVGIRLGLLFGIGFAVFKVLQARRPSEVPLPAAPPDPWPPVPAPAPKPAPAPVAAPAPKPAVQDLIEGPPPVAPKPVKKAAKATKTTKAVKKATKATKAAKKATRDWVEPQGGVCPLSHPVKAKVASMIFHLPGMLNYTRTRPDRCYATETAAQRDGFTPAKR
jgi:hypothetical protein